MLGPVRPVSWTKPLGVGTYNANSNNTLCWKDDQCLATWDRFRVRISIFQILKLQVATLPSLLTAVNRLRQAVKVGNGVLVEGVSGCGKSTVINALATLISGEESDVSLKPHLVTLHLGEHTDAKVCSSLIYCILCGRINTCDRLRHVSFIIVTCI